MLISVAYLVALLLAQTSHSIAQTEDLIAELRSAKQHAGEAKRKAR